MVIPAIAGCSKFRGNNRENDTIAILGKPPVLSIIDARNELNRGIVSQHRFR